PVSEEQVIPAELSAAERDEAVEHVPLGARVEGGPAGRLRGFALVAQAEPEAQVRHGTPGVLGVEGPRAAVRRPGDAAVRRKDGHERGGVAADAAAEF